MARYMGGEPNGGVFWSPNLSLYSFSGNNAARYVDPDGKFLNFAAGAIGAGIGGLIGAGVEFGFQAYHGGDLNYSRIGAAAVGGAVAGGLAGLTGGASLIATVGVGAASSAAGGATTRALTGEGTTVGDVAQDAIVGGLTAGLVRGGSNWLASRGAAANAAAAKQVHGNSRLSTRAQHGYEIVDTTSGEVVKTGVSSGARTASGGSIRANRQASAWNRQAGQPGRYEPRVVHEVPAGPGARQQIIEWEAENAGRLREAGQLRDPTKHVRP